MSKFITHQGSKLAYRTLRFHSAAKFGVTFLSGFKSNMHGTKASLVGEWAAKNHVNFTAFDYFAHGESQGDFIDGNLSRWVSDACFVLKHISSGPQVVIGSSMGGWIGSRLLELCPQTIMAFIGIAAAPDFTRDLWRNQLDDAARKTILEKGVHYQANDYDEPYPISKQLIDDGEKHFLLHKKIHYDKPVRLLHGLHDDIVPWRSSLDLSAAISSNDIVLELIKDGDHSLSRPQDMARLFDHLQTLTQT